MKGLYNISSANAVSGMYHLNFSELYYPSQAWVYDHADCCIALRQVNEVALHIHDSGEEAYRTALCLARPEVN